MLRAEPLLKIQLLILASEAADAALELARFGVFSPASGSLDMLRESPAEAYREAWLDAESRLSKLLDQCGDASPLEVPADAAAPTLADLEELNLWLKEVWSACLACHEGEERIQEESKHLDSLEETLSKLERLNVDLAHLLRHDSLLSVNIGSLPANGLKRVSEALSMTGTLVTQFDHVGDQVFAVIAGPRSRQEEVRGLLVQAGWRELPVPEELRTHPQAARNWMETERQRISELSGAECKVMGVLRENFAPRLNEARLRVALARPLAEAALAGVRGKGGLAALAGWVPRRQLNALRKELESRFHGRYWMESREPEPHEAVDVPSLVRYPAWLKPFVPLVKSYGVPRYGEFDPALPFAFTYLLLFGAMFGDIGHGGVILLLSILFARKLGSFAWVGAAAGAVSMLFGLLYGSIFGYEEIIEPVWLSPLHNPIHLLSLAVAFGVGFIVFTLLINARNKWVAGHRLEAVFDSTGLAGLVFYLGTALGLASVAGASIVDGIPQNLAWITAIFGILMVAGFKWYEAKGGIGERVLVTAIETLGNRHQPVFQHTFLYAGRRLQLESRLRWRWLYFTFAAGMSVAGHWVTIALGNVVIIVLEGGIVAIQALRLMYYEGLLALLQWRWCRVCTATAWKPKPPSIDSDGRIFYVKEMEMSWLIALMGLSVVATIGAGFWLEMKPRQLPTPAWLKGWIAGQSGACLPLA
jgi:V/A-type H+/Na+-transporting ATPase subunit I